MTGRVQALVLAWIPGGFPSYWKPEPTVSRLLSSSCRGWLSGPPTKGPRSFLPSLTLGCILTPCQSQLCGKLGCDGLYRCPCPSHPHQELWPGPWTTEDRCGDSTTAGRDGK